MLFRSEIEFRFEPKVFAVGEKVSFAGSLLLILMLVGFAATELWKKLKTDKTPAK